MIGIIVFFAGLAASLAGAYFIAYSVFKKLWKDKVTQGKLIGFLSVFITSFLAISFVIGYITSRPIPFGR